MLERLSSFLPSSSATLFLFLLCKRKSCRGCCVILMLSSWLLGSIRQKRTEGKRRRLVADSALLAGKSRHSHTFSVEYAQGARSFTSLSIINIVNRAFCQLMPLPERVWEQFKIARLVQLQNSFAHFFLTSPPLTIYYSIIGLLFPFFMIYEDLHNRGIDKTKRIVKYIKLNCKQEKKFSTLLWFQKQLSQLTTTAYRRFQQIHVPLETKCERETR